MGNTVTLERRALGKLEWLVVTTPAIPDATSPASPI